MQRFASILLFLMVAIRSPVVVADEPQPDVRRFLPNLDDIQTVTGLDIYSYRVKMKTGDRFCLILQEVDSRGDKPRELARETFTVRKAADIKLLVSFLHTDRRLASVLLSNAKTFEFGIRSNECDPFAIEKTIPVPLSKLPIDDKMFYFPASQIPREQSTTTGPTLLRVEKKSNERGTGYPRAELVMQIIK